MIKQASGFHKEPMALRASRARGKNLTVKLFLPTTDTISLLVCIGIEEDMGRAQT